MAVPKRRTSKMKQRTRAASKRWRKPLLQNCPECGSRVPGHIACPSCGYYKKQQVLNVDL